MVKIVYTSDTRVLVGIDVSKHRYEVLIAIPGRRLRRRKWQHPHGKRDGHRKADFVLKAQVLLFLTDG